jgi:phosphoribosylformylglycinamidine synthase PurS subunit
MKATVIVTLKPTVLDPQGITIHRSLGSLGMTDITDVRQGKIFNIELKDGRREQVERLAKEVLTNPVIEEYRIIWEQV